MTVSFILSILLSRSLRFYGVECSATPLYSKLNLGRKNFFSKFPVRCARETSLSSNSPISITLKDHVACVRATAGRMSPNVDNLSNCAPQVRTKILRYTPMKSRCMKVFVKILSASQLAADPPYSLQPFFHRRPLVKETTTAGRSRHPIRRDNAYATGRGAGLLSCVRGQKI